MLMFMQSKNDVGSSAAVESDQNQQREEVYVARSQKCL